MADPITNMQAADDAYQAALAALAKVHQQQMALIAANPIDWIAYNAALTAAASGQNAAQAALSVYKAAILNTPAVAALVAQLQADTATMTARSAALTAEATTLTDLATAADTVTQTLVAIAKFVAI